MKAPFTWPELDRPRGLMSLWDVMFNFQVGIILSVLEALSREEIAIASRPSAELLTVVSESDKSRIQGHLEYIARIANQLRLEGTHEPIDIFTDKLSYPGMTNGACLSELAALRENFVIGLRYVRLYLYPKEKSLLIIQHEVDWKKTWYQFREVRDDIISAIDCYAMGHNTACVFHLMRVAERGLRALAKERQVTWPKHPIEWATWQDILGEIEKKVKPVSSWPRGEKRDAALGFYMGP